MPFNPLEAAGTGQQLLGSATQMGIGTLQYIMAIQQALKNKRPFYNIDPSYQQNIDILKNTMGLPQSALDLYYNRSGQGTSQGINAILANGGNPNMIAGLVNNQNMQYQNVMGQDALQRKQDLNSVMAAQLALAEQKDKQWQINQYAPYADKSQAIALEKAAGLQNIGGAFNTASGATANGATMKLADSLGGDSSGEKLGDISTPNSGVNTMKIYQSLYGNKNQGAFYNPNTLNIGNIPQAQQLNLPQPYYQSYNPYNGFNPNMNFGYQQPNLSMYNPNTFSLWNTGF